LTAQVKSHDPELAIIFRSPYAPELKQDLSEAGLFVNPTSVGMYSNEEAELPLPAAGLPSRLGVVDVVYRPACTKLPAAAKSRGCRGLNGSKLPVRPGTQAFKLWTGGEAPVSSHGKGPSASISKNATGKEKLNSCLLRRSVD
jgi:shikimate 5-dehydrogenase